ncbi:ATP-binding protein [Klenkia sp. LSe6-5]|uniref:ATP-binding protein n=1 Tax=Klenkia sesuvii TaxID=3103137 RepID=A0ABU8DSX4_9ACTN
MTLFGAADLEAPVAGASRQRVGHRLHRFELFNWGTFDGQVWSFVPGGADSLLTGDIGSGKSTVVDALTTLLVPPQRIAFNRAAGGETKERDLRSYVLGHHKSERNEATGRTLPVGLRRGPTFSVLLAVFGNEGLDTRTSLAAVFWLADGQEGQPDRFYVTAERELSIASDLTGFGGDPAALRKRLVASGAAVHDSYRPYGERFRRLLGIPSPQALELFAQTVSMKAVSNLTEFVRHHMLEPFDARRRVDQLVDHFEALSKAHDAVVAARTQVDQLDPLLGQAAVHEELTSRIAALAAERAALPAFVAARTVAHLQAEAAAADERLTGLVAERDVLDGEIRRAGDERAAAELQMEGHGGARLREIGLEIEHQSEELRRRQDRSATHAADLEILGLAPAARADAFAARRAELGEMGTRLADEQARLRADTDGLAVASARLADDERSLNADLRAARDRRVNIPVAQLDLRSRLLQATGLAEAELPFAGELLQVRPEHRDWEGAAERVLRGLGLSLLVPDRHYRTVSDWIEGEHLRGRLVYYAVPTRAGLAPAPRSKHPLSDVVEVKDDPLAGWLRAEVAVRADLERVETMADFRRAERAVTRAGQLKGGRNRHEKDDRFRIDDRRNFVLGWSAEARIDALLDAARDLGRQREELAARGTGLDGVEKQVRARAAALDRATTVREFADVDWPSVAHRIDALGAERDRLTSASGELSRLRQVRDDAAAVELTARTQRDAVVGRIGSTTTERERALVQARERGVLAAEVDALPPAVVDALATRVPGRSPRGVAAWDAWEKTTLQATTSEHDAAGTRRSGVENRLTALMRTFRQAWPLLTQELDDTVGSIIGYRELHQRLAADDLPRFEAEFQELLRTNAIRDIAELRAELRKQEELIGERIDRINESLHGIDYNTGRFIRLETERTPNQEVRTFQADLLACTDDSLTAAGDPEGLLHG